MPVTVIGVDGETLPPGAAQALASARLVVGGQRHLAKHAPDAARRVELGNLDSALNALRGLAELDGAAVVLASGDPGFFGVLRAIRAAGMDVVVHPAISSVQRIAALAGRPWDDVVVVSAHGRELGPALNACRTRRPVAVLTGPGSGPAELAAGLAGWRRTFVVAEDLGGDHEQVTTLDATTAAGREWRTPNVVLCLPESDSVSARGWLAGYNAPADGWALPESAFAHRDGMVTKSEIRAVALPRLAPRLGTLIWDVGAGSGAVGVECARLGSAVIAIERDPGQCVRIVANAAEYGVDVRLVDGTAPEVLTELPRPDAIFVGGGGVHVVRACAEVGARRMVVALAAIDRMAPARDALRWGGYDITGVQISAARLADLPGGASRLEGSNPVLLLCGERPAE
jgi:precorrin-6Y C5,15-methyltransferase (decarboxylating)